MTLRLFWPCEACGEPADAYAAGPFIVAGQTLCAACVDDLGIPDPDHPDNSPDWYGAPGGRGLDDARDRYEEDSL